MTFPAKQLREFLSGAQQPLNTLDWLQQSFMPGIQTNMNTTDVRRRLGLYGGERIPENERNLTDVRNRVSLIIEYELARIATRLIEDSGVNDLFWSYVVANRFPDLEVRNSAGKRGLRIEVKCLQSVAEEKSANFDTLRKDVHPLSDFIVVFLWEWKHDGSTVKWDRAPFIERVFVFHAASLAQLRDWYWLNCPPHKLGDGLQGFDLRYAVNCSDGNYNQEEGNYGKLLRLWQPNFPHEPSKTSELDRTRADYIAFQRSVIEIGFDNISDRLLPELTGEAAKARVDHSGKPVGWRAGDAVFVLDSDFEKVADLLKFVQTVPNTRVFVFTSKYAWRQWEIVPVKKNGHDISKLRAVNGGKKPKYLLPTLLGQQPSPAQAIASGQDES